MVDLCMLLVGLINLQKIWNNCNKFGRSQILDICIKLNDELVIIKIRQTDNFIIMLSLVQEEVIYVISIVAPFILMCFTRFGQIQHKLELPKDIFAYVALFSCVVLANSVIEKIANEVQRKIKKIPMISQQFISQNNVHIALGIIFATIINYGVTYQYNVINSTKIQTLACWFIVSRASQVLGCVLNLLTGDKVWTVFGDSMTFLVILASLSISLGFDSFLLL